MEIGECRRKVGRWRYALIEAHAQRQARWAWVIFAGDNRFFWYLHWNFVRRIFNAYEICFIKKENDARE